MSLVKATLHRQANPDPFSSKPGFRMSDRAAVRFAAEGTWQMLGSPSLAHMNRIALNSGSECPFFNRGVSEQLRQGWMP